MLGSVVTLHLLFTPSDGREQSRWPIRVGGWGGATCDDGTILVTMSPSDRLYLTRAESRCLAEQIRQELVCRTTADLDEPVMVADIPMSPADAWQLLGRLEELVERSVDWQREGF